MNKKEYLTLEQAEEIVDNMYQSRWEECGVDDGNTIHMGNLDKLEYTELEKTSILLLRTELRLKNENQQLKDIINKAKEYINKCLMVCSILDGKKGYCLNDYKFDYKELLEILDNKGE